MTSPEVFIACEGKTCAHWRWVPLTPKEPGWKEAMKTLITEGMNNTTAAQAMLTKEVKTRFKLPLKPYKGYCGLSGKPQDFS
jgi:hypothetical protein